MRSLLSSLSRVGFAVAAALACGSLFAGALLTPVPAPDWEIETWFNGNPGQLMHQRGKVVVLHFFQLWCPGCNNFSIPLMRYWAEKYADRDDLVLISIHSVFEGHDVQTTDRLREFIRTMGMEHPVGVDAYEKPGDLVPITMQRYDTEGSPQVVIVDKEGMLRFSQFGRFDPGPVESFLERLLQEKLGGKSEVKTSVPNRPPAGRTVEQPPRRPTRDPGRRPPRDPGRRPSRPDRRDRDSGRDSDEPADDGGGVALSGKWKISVEESAKSCGALLPPQTVLADLSVGAGRVEARFTRPFLGLNRLQATYDSSSLAFAVDAGQRADQSGQAIDLSLELQGRFLPGAPPGLEYTFALAERGSEPDRDCDLAGSGSGQRLGG